MADLLLSNFIGPKAENIELLRKYLNDVLDFQAEWRKSFFKDDKSLYKKNFSNPSLKKEFDKFIKRAELNIPYFHPRYNAQMLKDPAIPAIIGYLTFMLSNPNNHAYEGGPVTTEMEMQVVAMMMKMVGYKKGWGH